MFSHRFSRLAGPALALGGLLWIVASIATVIFIALIPVIPLGGRAPIYALDIIALLIIILTWGRLRYQVEQNAQLIMTPLPTEKQLTNNPNDF